MGLYNFSGKRKVKSSCGGINVFSQKDEKDKEEKGDKAQLRGL